MVLSKNVQTDLPPIEVIVEKPATVLKMESFDGPVTAEHR
jgi:hypothetical protein